MARLNKIANLRKASRQHRATLGEIRSEMAAAKHEIGLIEQQLERIVQFPAAVANATVKADELDHQHLPNRTTPERNKKTA